MDTGKLQDWLQIVGLFSVVASLVFVGLQLKQTQEIAISNATQTRAWEAVEANLIKASIPTLNSGFAKIWVGQTDQLNPEEIVSLYWDYLAFLKMIEDNLIQAEAGFIDAERWEVNKEELRCRYSIPLYRQFGVVPGFRDSFVSEMSRIFEEAGENPSNCLDYELGSIWDWGDKIGSSTYSE